MIHLKHFLDLNKMSKKELLSTAIELLGKVSGEERSDSEAKEAVELCLHELERRQFDVFPTAE
jgi:hypothetical protein